MKKKLGFLSGFAVIALAAMFTMAGCGDNGDPSSPPGGGGGLDNALVATWHSTQAAADSGTSAAFEITADGTLIMAGATASSPEIKVTTSAGRISATITTGGQTMDGGSAAYVVVGTTLQFSNPSASAPAFTSLIAGQDVITTAGGDGKYRKKAVFVPVTGITNLPQISVIGDELELSGTVEPADATNQTITWSGNNVTGGKFKATTAGSYTVTATIANGKSATSPYTKTFTIKVSATTNAAINALQGTWTKVTSMSTPQGSQQVTLKMTTTGYSWTLDVDNNRYAEGIIIQATGSRYESQVNSTRRSDGQMRPYYSHETGTYSVNTGVNPNTLTLTTASSTSDFEMTGVWIKQQ